MTDKEEVTDDGYIIVKSTEPQKIIRGVQCGVCGMKFDYNVGYGYHCGNLYCPMRAANITMGNT